MTRWLEIGRDRFGQWRGDARLGVAVLVIVAVLVGVLWYRVGASGGQPSSGAAVGDAARRDTAVAMPGTTAGARPATTPTSRKGRGAGVVVHVAGAVVHPGVVELPVGSRVIDALEAVSGALADADLDRLNLAAKIIDGQRILVTRIGDQTAAAAAGSTPAADGAGGGPLVDLNTATQAQLEALPGIGPQLAGAIIAERDRRGGFRSVNELRTVHGIGDKRFADLRERVTV